MKAFYPEDMDLNPEEHSREEIREELTARGYTEIDFEVMEARANRLLQELHVHKILKRIKLDFTDLVPPKKPGS